MVHGHIQGPRILLIEENKDHAHTIEYQISRRLERPSVTVACNFDQALAIIDCKKFDVAVIDFPASESQGLALVRAIHESDPQAAIMVVAEDITEALVKRLFKFGCQELLVKDSSFCRVVGQLVDGLYRRKQKQLRARISAGGRVVRDLSTPARRNIARLSDEIDEPLGNILKTANMILERSTGWDAELENRVKSIQKAAGRIKDSLEAITGKSVPTPATTSGRGLVNDESPSRPKSGR